VGDLKLAFFLAHKSIFKGNRWALVLIVLVMSLSFANLLLTPSILLGVSDTINRQQVESLYGDIVVDPLADEHYLSGASEIAEAIEQAPGVLGVSARLTCSGLIEYDWRNKDSFLDRGKSGTWSVVGIDPVSEVDLTAIHEHLIEGSYLEAGDRDAILLGVEITGGPQANSASFQTLDGVAVGDSVRITYPNGIQREYTVKGIFRARESQADRTAFVTRAEMASVLGRAVYSDRASRMLVTISDDCTEDQVIQSIRSLGIAGGIRSWRAYGSAMGGVLSSFAVVAGLISGIGLVVAGIVMFIVIYINVIHSRRHIGILRAIGIKRDVIIGSYLVQALFYAAMGVLLGGLAFRFGIQAYFNYHPLDLSIGQVSLTLQPGIVESAVLGLVAAAVLAGLVPVFNITRQGIIRAIWGN
jgi:putative ABC transport system permease protein